MMAKSSQPSSVPEREVYPLRHVWKYRYLYNFKLCLVAAYQTKLVSSLCPARPQQVFLIHQSASVLLTVIGVIREPGKADDIQKCRDEGHLQQTSAFQISSTEISSDMLLNVLLYNPTEAQREQTSHTLPVCTGFCNLMYLFLYRSVQEKLFEAFIQISDADNLRVLFTCCSVQKKLSNFLPKFKAGR